MNIIRGKARTVFIAVIACFAAAGLARGTGTGCYIYANVPCNNSPSLDIDCKCPDGTSGGTKDCKKTVWFTITTPCEVPGNDQIPPAASGAAKQGKRELEPSVLRDCYAQGNFPDCDGKPTEIITKKVNCNTQIPKPSSWEC